MRLFRLPAGRASLTRNLATIAPDVRGTRRGHAVMHRLFGSAWQDELIPENPVARVGMPKIREQRKERVILSDAEIADYLACPTVDLELRLMSLCARVEGGMRTSDVNRWDFRPRCPRPCSSKRSSVLRLLRQKACFSRVPRRSRTCDLRLRRPWRNCGVSRAKPHFLGFCVPFVSESRDATAGELGGDQHAVRHALGVHLAVADVEDVGFVRAHRVEDRLRRRIVRGTVGRTRSRSSLRLREPAPNGGHDPAARSASRPPFLPPSSSVPAAVQPSGATDSRATATRARMDGPVVARVAEKGSPS
jgi:hypothetical protein